MAEFFLSVFYFIIFCLVIKKVAFFNTSPVSNNWYIVIFGVKVIISIFITILYTSYYTNRETADIFKYFDDSKIMFDALKTRPLDYFKMLFGIDNDNQYFDSNYYHKMFHWYRFYGSNLFSDSHTIIRFNAFVRLFSFGHFQVHNIFMNFFSLIGLTAIYRTFVPYLGHSRKLLFYLLFLFPSVLFWGSGLLKEGILFFALGILMWSFFKLMESWSISSLLTFILSAFIIIFTKLYIVAALIPSILGYVIFKKLKNRKASLGYGLGLSILLLASLYLAYSSSRYDPFKILIDKQSDFIALINRPDVQVNSDFQIAPLNDRLDVVKTIPSSLVNSLIRPYPWECNSFLSLVSSLENILVVLSILFGIIFWKRKKVSHPELLYFCMIYVICLFIIIGLTTPVFGAISRYKIPGIPFLLISLLLILDINRLKNQYVFLQHIL